MNDAFRRQTLRLACGGALALLASAPSTSFAQAAPEAAPPAATDPSVPAAPAPAAPIEDVAPSAAPVAPIEPPPAAADVTPAPAPVAEPVVVPVLIAPAPEEPAPADPLAATARFKPGKGLEVKSADGNFMLNTRLRLQFLEQFDTYTAPGREDRNAFIMRRVRLTFGGNVFSPNVKFKLDLTFAGQLKKEPIAVLGKSGSAPVDAMGEDVSLVTDGDVLQQGPIMDAYVEFTYIRDANLRVGQGKVPYGRERMMSDGALQTVDRTIESDEFNVDRDIGIDLRGPDIGGLDLMRYYAGVYMGEDRNMAFKSFGGGDLGLLYVARVELLPFGIFDDESAVDFAHSDPKLSIGVAYLFLQADAIDAYAKKQLGETYGPPDTVPVVDFNSNNFTADAMFKGAGISAMAAFHYRNVADFEARNGVGFTAQAGYFVSQEAPVEVQANYSIIRPTGDHSDLEKSNAFGFGVNYYLFGDHAVKLQADYTHLWITDADYSADNRVRAQLQLSL